MIRLLILFVAIFIGVPRLSVAAEGVFSKHILRGSKDTFTGNRLWVWAIGGTATLVAISYDSDVYEEAYKEEYHKKNKDFSDFMGSGVPGAGLAVLSIGTGFIFSSAKLLNAGISHAEALSATFFYTTLLKLSVERDRSKRFVSSGDVPAVDSSFPSAHTSTVFATAGSMTGNFGFWTGLPFLTMGYFTGRARVLQGAHYLSDVLFGATLGFAVGLGYSQHHQKGKSGALTDLEVYPYFETRDNWGLMAMLRF